MNNYDEVKSKGYDVIVCTTVNDAFVTAAWAKDLKCENKIKILADPQATFAKVHLYLHILVCI